MFNYNSCPICNSPLSNNHKEGIYCSSLYEKGLNNHYFITTNQYNHNTTISFHNNKYLMEITVDSNYKTNDNVKRIAIWNFSNDQKYHKYIVCVNDVKVDFPKNKEEIDNLIQNILLFS